MGTRNQILHTDPDIHRANTADTPDLCRQKQDENQAERLPKDMPSLWEFLGWELSDSDVSAAVGSRGLPWLIAGLRKPYAVGIGLLREQGHPHGCFVC